LPDNVIEVRYHDKYLKWLDKLKDRMARLRIAARLKRIREKGFFGDQKFFGDDVWELRIDYGPGYRVYYTRQDGKVIVLLCGGDKSTQADDIKLARQLAKEV
jgi:putative addiction module killer protein